MLDIDIIKTLKKNLSLDFKYKLIEDKCTELFLNSHKNIFVGSIRHFSDSEKNDILNLISDLTNLQILDLSFNKIKEIPEKFSNLRNISNLNLKSCNLLELPHFLKECTTITSLNLSSNHLTKLPDFVNNLTHLQYLNLSKNIKIRHLDNIQAITNIRVLDLYLLNLNKIPDFVYTLQKLKSIFLWKINKPVNNLNCFPKLEGIRWYGSSHLKTIPDSIYENQNIVNFDFAMNGINNISADIEKLSKLETCSLFSNKLTKLPDSFLNLRYLNKLDISKNLFKELPQQLTKLTNLNWLCCYDNPFEICDMLNIKTIIHERPFTN